MAYLENKQQRYLTAARGDCFEHGLKGLTFVELNLTELCNRTCAFCPRHDPTTYPNRPLFMKEATVRLLAEQLAVEKYTGEISIAGFGEPLLHPEVVNFVQILSSVLPDVTTTLITNGDKLTNASVTNFIKAGLKRLVVSCYDGPEQIPHFTQMLEGKLPFLLKELWYTDNFSFQERVNKNHFNRRTQMVQMIEEKHCGSCYLPFYRMFLDWNGDFRLCSNDWGRAERGLPNIYQNTLREIWSCTRFIQIRKHLANGIRTESPACRQCFVNGTLMGEQSFLIHQCSL